MKSRFWLAAIACALSACAAAPSVAPGTTVPRIAVPEGAVVTHGIQATVGLQLASTRLLAAGDAWTAADLSAVQVHLFRQTGSAWTEQGGGRTFAAGTHNLNGPLTMTLSGLERNTPYRLVAIALGDDGGTSVDATGAALPDVNAAATGTRRADRNFALGVGAIANAPDAPNRFDFTTGTDALLDLQSGDGPPNFRLYLRDKFYSGAASGIQVSITPGIVEDPADTGVQLASALTKSGSFNLGDLRFLDWYDTGVVLSPGQQFAIQASANLSGNGGTYSDGFTSTFISADGNEAVDIANCRVAHDGSLGFYGAVIGRIGSGPAFKVGSNRPLAPAEGEGHLFLTINNVAFGPDTFGEVNATVWTR